MLHRRDLLSLPLFVLPACGPGGRRIRIGSKDTVEQRLLGEIVAAHISARLGPKRVERHLSLGDTRLTHEAAIAGQIDLYPEYAGIALCHHLKLPPVADSGSARDQIAQNYPIRFRFDWLVPLGFANPPAAVIRKDRAESIRTLGQAALDPKGWVIGFTREYEQRGDGSSLLLGAYSLRQSRPYQLLPETQLLPALDTKQISMAITERTDPRIDPARHVTLADADSALPPYDATLVVRVEALEASPELLKVLNQLSGKLTFDHVCRMRADVQLKGHPPGSVAASFLSSAGL